MEKQESSQLRSIQDTMEVFGRVAGQAGDYIFVIDGNLCIRYVNDCTAGSFGREPDELIGKPLWELFPPHSYDALKMNLRQVLSSGNPSSLTETLLFSHQELCMDARFTPIRDDSGTPTAVLGIFRDMTHREHQEELISRAKQEWEGAVDAMTVLVAVVDNRHRITRVNRALADKLGVSVQEAVGMLCYERLHGVDAPLSFCPLLQLATGGRDRVEDYAETHLAGDYLVNLSPLRDRHGRVKGCVYVAREVSEGEKRIEAKRRSEEHMRLLLKHAEHIVSIQDRDGKYVYFHATPEYGMRAADVRGKSPFDFFDPSKASRMVERVMRTAATGHNMSYIHDITWNGETLHFFEEMTPIREAGEEVRKVVTIARRVDERPQRAVGAHGHAEGVPGLSKREGEILKLIASGLTNKEIAERLFISCKTVATHRARIMSKLDIHKTSALVRYAVESGLL